MYVVGDTISETVFKGLKEIYTNGIEDSSRNGLVKYVNDYTFQINDPRSRHLMLLNRTSNIFGMIGEMFWVLAGADYIDPYLSFFVPRASNYSDDGLTWWDAYGPRIYRNDQMFDVINTFKSDGKATRRAYISIVDPNLDVLTCFKKHFPDQQPKAFPCNQLIHFYISEDKFNMKVVQRSGDFIFGAGSINPFEFTVLQELVYNEVKKLYPEISLGTYRWHVTNAHLYEAHFQQVQNILNEQQPFIRFKNTMELTGPYDFKDTPEFFSELVSFFSYLITDDTLSYCQSEIDYDLKDLRTIFDKYEVVKSGNMLWNYALITLVYILSKKHKDQVIMSDISSFTECDMEFLNPIVQSTFRKFAI